jgi:hypothetical protein
MANRLSNFDEPRSVKTRKCGILPPKSISPIIFSNASNNLLAFAAEFLRDNAQRLSSRFHISRFHTLFGKIARLFAIDFFESAFPFLTRIVAGPKCVSAEHCKIHFH